ncbi:hypothetical protein [Neobacillus sp. FSL H8-0543]|uniref:hypothetical protein n=1 Tax=Neobacillus sp. FSL H8-0543 TaxID=2954672 RepID=UPI0031581933
MGLRHLPERVLLYELRSNGTSPFARTVPLYELRSNGATPFARTGATLRITVKWNLAI